VLKCVFFAKAILIAFGYFGLSMFCMLVVLLRLSVPVQVIDWKDWPRKSPSMGTFNPTHSSLCADNEEWQ